MEVALDQLEAAVGTLASVPATDLSPTTITDAVRRLGKVDGRLDGITARLVAAAEDAGTPEADGATSTTSWVAEQTGRSRGQAARTGKLAKSSRTTPELADAVADGTVGPDQAQRIATGLDRGTLDPDDATDLLSQASHLPPGPFSREASRLEGRRHQQRLRKQESAARDARYCTTWRTDDGSLRIEARLPGVAGDKVEKALNAFVHPDGADTPDDQRRTPRQLRADALADLADAALTAGVAGQVGKVRPHVTVVVPYEAMAQLEDAEEAGVTAVSDLDTVLSADAFNRLACDATFRRLVLDPDGQPLNLGRATRVWTSSQRFAVLATDGGCRGPGCDLPGDRCELHHVRWWKRDNGPTDIANAAPLCGRHHDLIHDEILKLELDPVTRICTWTTVADGTVRTTHPTGPAADRLGGACSPRESRGPRPAALERAAPGGRQRARPPGRDSRTEAIDADPPNRGDPGRSPPSVSEQTLPLDL